MTFYSYFYGTDQNLWRLSRTLSTGDTMEGIAVFKPCDNECLHYFEKGLFHRGGPSSCDATEFYQEYLYIFNRPVPFNGFSICFATDEQKTFMMFDCKNQNAASSHHLCKNDAYTGFFEQMSDNVFSLIYHVKGPRKDYHSVTYYTRS